MLRAGGRGDEVGATIRYHKEAEAMRLVLPYATILLVLPYATILLVLPYATILLVLPYYWRRSLNYWMKLRT